MIGHFMVPSPSDKTGPLSGTGSLTLYTIEQEKGIDSKEQRIASLEECLALLERLFKESH